MAALLLGGTLALASPRARGLECPQAQLTTSGSSVPEDGVLVISMSSPDSYVTGFDLVVRAGGGSMTLVDETYYTNPAREEVRPIGLARFVLVITVNAECRGAPWVSDPVSMNVVVVEGADPPPPPPPPTDPGWTWNAQDLWIVVLIGLTLLIIPLVYFAGRGPVRAVRCPRCRTRYRAGAVLCPRDGTVLAAPPPPPPPPPLPPGWR